MTKGIALVVVILSLLGLAEAADPVVKCFTETTITACGVDEDSPCNAEVKNSQPYDVDDILKITYNIPADFDNDVCSDGSAITCDTYTKVIFFKVIATVVGGEDIQISQSGAQELCPENCLTETVANNGVFTGICQPGGGSKVCAFPDEAPITRADARELICSEALGSTTDAVVTVECFSGSCVEESSTAEPEDESSTAEPEDESSTAEPEEESSTAEPEDESSTADPEDPESTSTGIDGGSAFALTSGAAALYASLLVAVMHVA